MAVCAIVRRRLLAIIALLTLERTLATPIIFAPNCKGDWGEWSNCSADCYQTRELALSESAGCVEAIQDGEIDMRICDFGECPLTPNGDKLKELLFRAPISSFRAGVFEDLINYVQLFVVFTLLTVLVIVGFLQQYQIKWVPDLVVAIPVAAVFPLLLHYVYFNGVNFGPAANSIVGNAVSSLMNHLLLPVTIFDGGFFLQRRNFWSQFGYGILFSVVGTGLSCFLIAAMVKYSGDAGFHPVDGWRESIAYGAFIADVDPIATLAIFSSLKVDSLLSTLVAAEATLNDPVALVIFGVCNKHTKELHFSLAEEGLNAAILLVGSITFGCLLGLVLIAIFSYAHLERGAVEAAYFLACGYAAYSFGDAIGMSGIIVTLFCGLIMGVYAPRLISDCPSVYAFLGSAARLADIGIFLVIGFGTVLVNDRAGVTLGLLTILFCFISRAVMVALLVGVANVIKRVKGEAAISFGIAFMIFHSGLRGGMTIMMALLLDSFWSKNQNTLVVATIVTVIGLTYLCGCTGPLFLKLTGVATGVPQIDGDLFNEGGRATSVVARIHGKLLKALVRNKTGTFGSPLLEDDDGDDTASSGETSE